MILEPRSATSPPPSPRIRRGGQNTYRPMLLSSGLAEPGHYLICEELHRLLVGERYHVVGHLELFDSGTQFAADLFRRTQQQTGRLTCFIDVGIAIPARDLDRHRVRRVFVARDEDK